MAIAEVSGQKTNTIRQSAVATATVAFPNPVALDSLVVMVGGVWNANTVTSITVTKSSGGGAVAGGFTTIFGSTGVTYAGGTAHEFIAYGIVTTAGTLTLQVATSDGTANNYYACGIDEFSGVDTSTPLDVNGGEATGSSAGSFTDTITTATSNDLVIGVLIADHSMSNLTPGAGYTQIDEDEVGVQQPFGAEFKVVTTATTYNVDWTLTEGAINFACVDAAFKEATAPSSDPLIGAFMMT